MAAKGKTAQPKTSRKVSEPTPIKEVLKKSKAAVKATKKPAAKKAPAKKRKPAAPKPPVITDHDFRQYFMGVSQTKFMQLVTEWNEENLKIKLKKHDDYDGWLNYFKTVKASHIRILARTGQDLLGAEGYAALARWIDIIGNPGRIDKIHQAGLTKQKTKGVKSIAELAATNDRLGVLKATRDKIAEKLEKGAGARDTAALARELTEVMTQIADYEKRLGPKKDTMLRQLMDGAPGATTQPADRKKRPAKNGTGARNTSWASRVTIEDIEAE